MVGDHLHDSCLKLPDLSFSLGFSAPIFTPNTLRFQFAKGSQSETVWFPKAALSGLQRTVAKLNPTCRVTNP